MSTGNADSVIVPARNDTEEVCTLEHGNTACLCGHELGIVSHYSGSMDDEVCALDIFGALTDEHGDTHISYGVESFGLVVVRAGEVVALSVEYLREGIHSRAADTDEVDVFFTA